MYNEFAYAMEEVMGSMSMSLMMNAGSSLMSIVISIFTSLSLYTIAKRRDFNGNEMFPFAFQIKLNRQGQEPNRQTHLNRRNKH